MNAKLIHEFKAEIDIETYRNRIAQAQFFSHMLQPAVIKYIIQIEYLPGSKSLVSLMIDY